MTDIFARWNLRPFERRLVVGVAVVLFLVINVVWVWPHFSDWSAMTKRLSDARDTKGSYQKEIDKLPEYKRQVATMESDGASVPAEDQAVQFMRTVTSQAAQDRINVTVSRSLPLHTNQFFMEQIQNITVQARDEDLVNFLYNLGSGASLIRVRDLSLHPDGPRLQLVGNIKLVASYRKNPAVAKPAAPVANPKPATNQTSTPLKK
jgi:Tfp pilus assembly protein PilO